MRTVSQALLAMLVIVLLLGSVPAHAAPGRVDGYAWLIEMKKVIAALGTQDTAVRDIINSGASFEEIATQATLSYQAMVTYEKPFHILLDQAKTLDQSSNPYTAQREFKLVINLMNAFISYFYAEEQVMSDVVAATKTRSRSAVAAAYDSDDALHAWYDFVDAYNDCAAHWNARLLSR